MEERLSPVGPTGVPSAGALAPPGIGTRGLPRRFERRAAPWSSTTFVAATEWLDSGAPVISVTGELDLATAPVLEEALHGVSDNGRGAVTVDLAGCSFIDLRGLHVLLDARARLVRTGRPLILITGNPTLLRVFKITRVDCLFEIYPSRAAAAEVNDSG